MRDIHFDGIELRSIHRINRELAWRIVDHNPYEHYPAKPRHIQAQLRNVRGVGRKLAGKIYRKIVKNSDPEEIVESVESRKQEVKNEK